MSEPPGGVNKPGWRRVLAARRAALSAEVRAVEAEALAAALARALDTRALDTGGLDALAPDVPDAAAPSRSRTACGYWPVGAEPGSGALLDVLRERGWRVLLPVVTSSGPLDWAEYTGPDGLRAGRWGLREPAGPALGSAAIRQAALVLVPALAVDRRGVRLGRGAGYYDRTLPLAPPGAVLVAVVRDEEVVDELPAEAHDVPVAAALTPRAGLVRLPRSHPG